MTLDTLLSTLDADSRREHFATYGYEAPYASVVLTMCNPTFSAQDDEAARAFAEVGSDMRFQDSVDAAVRVRFG